MAKTLKVQKEQVDMQIKSQARRRHLQDAEIVVTVKDLDAEAAESVKAAVTDSDTFTKDLGDEMAQVDTLKGKVTVKEVGAVSVEDVTTTTSTAAATTTTKAGDDAASGSTELFV